MEHMENDFDPNLTPDEVILVRLVEQAMRVGTVPEDRLLDCLGRLKASPEEVEKFCAQLRDAQVQIVRPEEEPQYSPELRQEVIELLEQEELLSERENLVLTMRLKENRSSEEVAARMGVTRTRILQVERKAIRRLRSSRAQKIRDFYE